MGRKLRKDLGRVKNALPKVSSDDVKAYIDTGKITVDGIQLVEGDLQVQRYIELPKDQESQYATHTDNDAVIRLDIQVHPDLMGEWISRELIQRVQKLRKKAGLQATDDVLVVYQLESGLGEELVAAMKENEETIRKTLRTVPVDVSKQGKNQPTIIQEEVEVADVKFLLSLAKL